MSEKDEDELIEVLNELKQNEEKNIEEDDKKFTDKYSGWYIVAIILLCVFIPYVSIPLAIISAIYSYLSDKSFVKVFYKIFLTVFIMFIIACGGCLLLFLVL